MSLRNFGNEACSVTPNALVITFHGSCSGDTLVSPGVIMTISYLVKKVEAAIKAAPFSSSRRQKYAVLVQTVKSAEKSETSAKSPLALFTI